MGEDTIQNMQSSFPEINKLCKVASPWKYIKTNINNIQVQHCTNKKVRCTFFRSVHQNAKAF